MKKYVAYYTNNSIVTVKAISLNEAKRIVPASINNADLWDVEEAK